MIPGSNEVVNNNLNHNELRIARYPGTGGRLLAATAGDPEHDRVRTPAALARRYWADLRAGTGGLPAEGRLEESAAEYLLPPSAPEIQPWPGEQHVPGLRTVPSSPPPERKAAHPPLENHPVPPIRSLLPCPKRSNQPSDSPHHGTFPAPQIPSHRESFNQTGGSERPFQPGDLLCHDVRVVRGALQT